jgi:hypothetical protein
MSNQEVDLGNLINADNTEELAEQSGAESGPTEDDFIGQIMAFVASINDSVASMQIGLRTISNRLSSAERHISYLLEQDPVAGPKIKEHLKKLDEAAAASKGPELDVEKQ